MIKKLHSLTQNDTFVRYAKNASWMLAEYALRIISAIFVTIYVARYLGPESFGVLSYALAMVAIFMVISRLGMESILVRELASDPARSAAYLGTALVLMLLAAFGNAAILGGLVWWLESDLTTQLYIGIIALGLFFQIFLVIDYHFQAQVQAKFASIAKSLALLSSSLIKIYLVLTDASLQAFVVAYAVDQLLIAGFLIVTYWQRQQPAFLTAFDRRLVRPLLKSAWPMVLSAVAFMLYSKLDQLMIRHFLDMQQLGLYAAAAKIFEGWVMLPFIIIVSLMPAIVKLKQSGEVTYRQKLVLLYRGFFWLSISVAAVMSLLSPWLMTLLFGEAFQASATPLTILMWAAVFTTMGTLTARILVAEKIESKLFKMTLFGLAINALLNVLWIPVYGIEGAAYASLVSLWASYFLYDWLDRELQFLRVIKLKALFNIGKLND